MKNKYLLSILVLNWNGKRFIDPFFKSLIESKHDFKETEIIFIDNNSSDDSVQYVNKYHKSFANLKVLKNDSNLGYAGGNNEGIKLSNGEYILICNNDLELEPLCISNLLEAIRNTTYSIVVPKLMFKNKPGIINNAGSKLLPDKDWPITELGSNSVDIPEFNTNYEISAFCGACVIFNRQFFKDVGMFDQKYFMYWEDTDLSWRGQKMNKKYLYFPDAIAYHYHTGSSKEGSSLFNHYVGRNRIFTLFKNAKLTLAVKSLIKMDIEHGIFKLGRILKNISNPSKRKHYRVDYMYSLKMLVDLHKLLPYIILKRFNIIHEKKISK